MNNILIGTAILFILIGAYTLWVLPANDWRKIVRPIGLVIVFIAQCYVSLLGLGQPVPSWVSKDYSNAQVYSYYLREPEEIDLWVFVNNELNLTFVKFPWDVKMAQAFIDQFEHAHKGEIIRLHPGDLMPYIFKVEALPDKEGN